MKARSRLAGLTSLLDYTQLFVGIMAMVCSPVLFAYLLAAYGLIYLLFPQPFYPIYDILSPLTPESLVEDVKKPGTELTWVVYYYAPWHAGCRHMAPEIVDLAARYATDKLKFAELDLGEYSKLASTLGIDLSPISQQLPAVLLYEKGEEVVRLPVKKGGRGGAFKAKDIVRVMDLENRHARLASKSSEKKSQ
ncbi:hypothetical protein GPECTOR_1g80 [Gonium pectorale]|uniref:Thioredoxin domain-containing protein n=1 Tax=Gonium pectorale TaxID=33097 RepID=A0A150H414_GONPE|nr:hypothetical protein GPECTOR_1g80 [Gonium pectorale]|eukprot:KXZ56887.1 hypothetical protein GPECTOR_1g80 [Gonium pectorale]